MKEEYVSYPQARLLKECGFDWECNHYYFRNNETLRWCYPADNYSQSKEFYSAPRLSSAQKWLREVHGLHITIESVMGGKWTYEVVDLRMKQDMSGEWYSPRVEERDGYPCLESYESALAGGITAAIELIKQK